jgi:hypothetical protein
MLAWGIALGIRLSGKSSAESAIQSLPGDWRMAHMMIEFVQEVNRAFSAGALFVPRILGRCPRLAVNCAFGAKLVPVARIASRPRRSLGGSGRLGSTVSQCAEDSARYSAKFAFRTHSQTPETTGRNGIVIGTSSFLRHSIFVLRHFFRAISRHQRHPRNPIKSKLQKHVDTLLASHLASPLPSPLHRRGKQLHFIHEKENHFAISIL